LISKFSKEQWLETCQGDEQCLYDSAAMGSLEVGERTRQAHAYYTLMQENMKSGKFLQHNDFIKINKISINSPFLVNSCGIYLMRGGIRTTSKGNYLVGSVMKLSCERGYTLFGWDEFYCNWNATWLPTNGQWIEEFRDWPYCERKYHLSLLLFTQRH